MTALSPNRSGLSALIEFLTIEVFVSNRSNPSTPPQSAFDIQP